MILPPGHKAPDFTLDDHLGERVRLYDLEGPKCIFFYPTAFSFYCGNKIPGMDGMGNDMRDAGIRHFLAISRESVWANRHFAHMLGLEHYRLCSDLDNSVAKAWGTFIPRSSQRVNKRAFFVLDGDNVLRHSHDVTLRPAEFDLPRLLLDLEALLAGPPPEPGPWDGPIEDADESEIWDAPGPGDEAPGFEVMDFMMNPVTLKQYLGQKIVLVFYNYDFHPACDALLVDLAAHRDEFTRRGAVVLAINRDNPYTHKAWAEERGFIGAHLLSDMNSAVARRWGVYAGGPERAHRKAMFVIDEAGRVAWRKVFPKQETIVHSAEVLKVLGGPAPK